VRTHAFGGNVFHLNKFLKYFFPRKKSSNHRNRTLPAFLNRETSFKIMPKLEESLINNPMPIRTGVIGMAEKKRIDMEATFRRIMKENKKMMDILSKQ
jgi:hypothetical protein